MDIKIALAGNPSCGKTTLFNALTDWASDGLFGGGWLEDAGCGEVLTSLTAYSFMIFNLLCAMAERFPGGMISFDAVNSLGLKGVDAEVKLVGESADSHFSLESPKKELESWSPSIVNVIEKDYADGYLKGGYR